LMRGALQAEDVRPASDSPERMALHARKEQPQIPSAALRNDKQKDRQPQKQMQVPVIFVRGAWRVG
jgi:hypothetical protein